MGKKVSSVESPSPSSLFISMGLDMSWRLAMGVLVPIIGGVELDKLLKTSPWLLLVGLGLSVVFAVLIIRRSVKLANNHPLLNQKDKANG